MDSPSENSENSPPNQQEKTESIYTGAGHRELKLKPSDSFLDELKSDEANKKPPIKPADDPSRLNPDENNPRNSIVSASNTALPPASAEPVGVHQVPIYPDASRGRGTDAPLNLGNDNAEYTAPNTRVCQRATSLKLYAVVMIILNCLVLFGAFATFYALSIVNAGSAPPSISTEVSDAVKIVVSLLPLISAVILLITKNVKLAKILLAINIADYIVGIFEEVAGIFILHNSYSFTFFIALIVSVLFMGWTWAVFNDVNGLMS